MINISRAFSLVELMVVIAIVAVLAAVAVPAYRQYMVKTKIIGTFDPVVKALKPKIIEFYERNGYFPTSPADIGLAASGIAVVSPSTYSANIQQIFIYQPGSTQCGALTIQISGTAVGGTFSDGGGGPNSLQVAYRFWPADSGRIMKTACGTYQNLTADYAYLPASCQDGSNGPAPGSTFSALSGGLCSY